MDPNLEERLRVEAALRESEARWRSFVENAPDVIWIVDRDLRIQFMNRVPRASELTLETVIGAPLLTFVRPQDREATGAAIRRTLDTGEPCIYEATVKRPSGEVITYQNHVAAVGGEGQAASAIVVSRDVTAQRHIDELKDDVIRDVSHELRTPLAKIQMSLELLADVFAQEPLDRARAARSLSLAQQSCRRLLSMVEGMLEIAALAAGARTYATETIRLGDLILESLREIEPLADQRGLTLRADLPETLPTVEGDRQRLRVVLGNLLDNAVKFSRSGEIVVTARALGHGVQVAVRDSGVGISGENLTRVFGRFFKEESHTSGVGIGLAICKTVVERHGGAIWAESPGRGQGTTVRFTLPSAASGQPAKPRL